jgi:hypothetical protein
MHADVEWDKEDVIWERRVFGDVKIGWKGV